MRQIKPRLNSLSIALILSIALGIFVACEEDYNISGSELIGNENLISDPDTSYSVSAYSKQLKGLRTNVRSLDETGVFGYYKDPVFGSMRVNYLAQMRMDRNAPSFGENAVVDSVRLYLPYYGRTRVNDIGTDTIFELDSIFNNKPMQIEIFESNYFLMQLDPNTGFETAKAYYTNQEEMIENNLGQKIGELSKFIPDNRHIILVEGEGEDKKDEKLDPGLYMDLSPSFFQQKIIEAAGTDDLVSAEAFNNYFRGLYIKAQPLNGEGSYFLFNNSRAYVKMYYSFDVVSETEDGKEETTRNNSEFKFDFNSSSKLNFIEKDLNPQLQQALVSSSEDQTSLYIQGGEALISVIELFGEDTDGSGVADELELLRLDKPIVNEANLVFHVDNNALGASYQEPERIVLYDLESGEVLIDYNLDATASANSLDTKIIHLGRLQKDDDGNGISYKLRLTNHISELINNEKENVKLGLAVIANINSIDILSVSEQENDEFIGGVLSGVLFSPRGTVLHGPKSPEVAKRLKLELYTTSVK